MKKVTYKLLNHIPVVGKIVEATCDPYVYINCSPTIANGTLQDACKMLKHYEETHRDEQLTRSLLKRLYRLRSEYLSVDNLQILEKGIKDFQKIKPGFRLVSCFAYKDFFLMTAVPERLWNYEDLSKVIGTTFYLDKNNGTIEMCNIFIDLDIMKKIGEINFEVNLDKFMTKEEIEFKNLQIEALKRRIGEC